MAERECHIDPYVPWQLLLIWHGCDDAFGSIQSFVGLAVRLQEISELVQKPEFLRSTVWNRGWVYDGGSILFSSDSAASFWCRGLQVYRESRLDEATSNQCMASDGFAWLRSDVN